MATPDPLDLSPPRSIRRRHLTNSLRDSFAAPVERPLHRKAPGCLALPSGRGARPLFFSRTRFCTTKPTGITSREWAVAGAQAGPASGTSRSLRLGAVGGPTWDGQTMGVGGLAGGPAALRGGFRVWAEGRDGGCRGIVRQPRGLRPSIYAWAARRSGGTSTWVLPMRSPRSR